MKIEKRQQKILLLAGIILGAILIFWIFIYSPKNKQMKEIGAELARVQKDIERIQKIAGGEESLDVVITKYNRKIKEFKEKLPAQEESTLRRLANKADSMGIEVLSISPQVAADSKLPVNIEGCQCRELVISMQLVASYEKLGEYLGMLKDKFPSVIRLNKVNIEKKGEVKGISELSASIEIALYMLVPE